MDPLLIVTVVLLVSCGAFGAGCLWKRHKEKQNVEGANPDPELQPAAGHGQVALPRQSQSPTKPSLLALIPTLSVRKVLPPSVQCSGQISAQWPRRKVAFFTVESGSFKAFGHRYSIEDPDKPQLTKKFYWAVGTLQTLCRIDRNTIEWQTNHSNPEWQRFLWVCTPECTHGSTSHATEFSASSYKCSICKSSGNEKHWQCVGHNVHFCCNCAVPPLKPPTLGVSARYAVDVFPPLARSTTGAQNPDFYAMCPRLALGEHGLGFRKICPRDGRPNCSLVDALEDQYSGKVTHFVSWCWGYTLQDFVSAVSAWLRRSELTPDDVFLWVCFFCNNQYRIMDEGTKTGSDELKAVFETHLAEAGQMNSIGFDKLNQTVRARLVERLVGIVGEELGG